MSSAAGAGVGLLDTSAHSCDLCIGVDSRACKLILPRFHVHQICG